MPNTINETGIQIKTLDEIIDSIVEGADERPGLKGIYGHDINIDSDTPDGQLVNIFALAIKDVLDLAVQTFNSFDPDLAVGRVLDQRCAINGVVRHGGSHTQARVRVTIDSDVLLPGLDNPDVTPFTVSDAEGNKYVLKKSVELAGPDTEMEPGDEPGDGTDTDSDSATTDYDLDFRAEQSGRVVCLEDTIKTVVTTVPGVVKIGNPPGLPFEIGADEESDFSLRARRARSLSLPAIGSAGGILSSILSVNGVTEAIVYENTSNNEDEDGIPGHSIWCIVAGGDGENEDEIAHAIYLKRNAGCGMKGETGGLARQEDGAEFTVLFDRPIDQDLWIKFKARTTTGARIPAPALEYLRAELAKRLTYSIQQSADITTVAKTAREIMPDVVICDAAVSGAGEPDKNEDWDSYVKPSSKRHRFILAEPRILIDNEDLDEGGEPGDGGEPGNGDEADE